jgi:hypothetical protein
MLIYRLYCILDAYIYPVEKDHIQIWSFTYACESTGIFRKPLRKIHQMAFFDAHSKTYGNAELKDCDHLSKYTVSLHICQFLTKSL